MVDFRYIAEQAAIKAGEILSKYKLGPLTDEDLESTDPNDPTDFDTMYDKLVGAFIREFLQDRSGIPTYAEGYDKPTERTKLDRFWWIDPIDGTRSFTMGQDYYSVSIGLVQDCKPVLGTIYQPKKEKLFTAAKYEGSFLTEGSGNPEPIHVSDRRIDNIWAILGTTDRRNTQDIYQSLEAAETGPYGSFTFKAAMIAEGKSDLYIKPNNRCNEWDSCAVEIVLEEAGNGRITDLRGRALKYNKDNPRHQDGIIVSNGIIHDEVIDHIERQITLRYIFRDIKR